MFQGYVARNREARLSAESSAKAAVGKALDLYRKCFTSEFSHGKTEHEAAMSRAVELLKNNSTEVGSDFAQRLQSQLDAVASVPQMLVFYS